MFRFVGILTKDLNRYRKMDGRNKEIRVKKINKDDDYLLIAIEKSK